ncbi:ArsR/SmtB family transcription factor [Paludisphaera mucosa]|uniref:Metalloregulator ArsR/SmtB family transcription factor n=1 Tax=Paludisphaera mucosa TaxID=3030827 RepID=A0ABT6F3X4_9BACT|nr:metalloregulator ArsR/SmtB family transcription factor [Paludisphaera mucosa]MDG3002219.1 metalloregulator ArsR/SmtB family transcription factor [Paludisphaera mucosa]
MARAPTTSDAFNAVAEPRRRQIIEFLARGERPVNDVVEALGLAQPQVSKHLRVLREVGLVSVRGAGRERLYTLNADRLKPIHDWVRTFEPFWDHQLDRIKERAERKAAERPAAKDQPDSSTEG